MFAPLSIRRLPICLALLCASPASASVDSAGIALRLERWCSSGGHQRLRPDAALSAAALENSRAVAELSVGERAPKLQGAAEQLGITEYLQFLLQRHQVRDAVVLALSGRFADPERLWQRLLGFLGEHVAGSELTHYGLGLAPLEEGTVATLILVRRRAELESLRAIPGLPLELCGSVHGHGDLRVLATTPSGRVLEVRPRWEGTNPKAHRRGRFCAGLGRAERGRYQLELMVDGAFGPEVAALFPLFVGESPPALRVQKIYPAATLDRESVEQEVLALLQKSRRRAGLAPLIAQAGLERAARHHSGEMLARGFFGHRSPWRGGLARRLADEQLPYSHASENLVLSTSAERAHDALMASPAHRRNLLDPTLTHVGIGVAVSPGRGLLYITQCFARIPATP